MEYQATPCDSADPSDKATAYADMELVSALANHAARINTPLLPERGAVCPWCLDAEPAADSPFCSHDCRVEWLDDAEKKRERLRRTHRSI